jgi:hypothetical protein
MEVEELLARAWKAVNDAGIPEPLQEYAFKEALARLSSGAPVQAALAPAAMVPTAEESTSEKTAKAPEPADLSDPFGKFALESDLKVEDLERVFYFDTDGLPHLNGPRARFGRSASDQAKVVAVAITAAYDYVLDEKPISDDVVKAEATRLKIDLAGNWARTMGDVHGVSYTGAARQKQFKVAAGTPEALKKLVASILGTPAE